MKYLIPTSAAAHLGKRIEEELAKQEKKEVAVVWPDLNKDGRFFFPDGEVYTRLSFYHSLEGQEIILLHSGQERPNDSLIELYHLLAKIKKISPSPKGVDIFFAYFPYGRQDKEFEEGELVSSEEIFDILTEWYQVDHIYIIDAHFAGSPFWRKPFIDVQGSEVIKKTIASRFPEASLSLGPDAGSQKRAHLNGINKKRVDSYTIKIKEEIPENLIDRVKEAKYVVCIDDLSLTGTTMINFYAWCKTINPSCIPIAGLTHGVKEAGINRVKATYEHFYLGNTIDRREANVDFTQLIMESLGIK